MAKKKLKYPLAMPKEAKLELKAGKAKLKNISPGEFLGETQEMEMDEGDRSIIRGFKKHIKHGHHIGPLKLYKDNIQDGRHRAEASKELGIKEVPVMDFRHTDDDGRDERALGGGIPYQHDLGDDDSGAFFRRLIAWSFAAAPVLKRADGGPVLEDGFPTHYLPEVGRQVMQGGGTPDDIEAAIKTANEVAAREGATHHKGVSGAVEFAPMSIEEPLTHSRLPLGTYPKGTTDVIQPALQAASEIAPYFTPAAPIAAARDVAVGLREGDPTTAALSALGLPGKAAKAAAVGAAALMPEDAEAGPIAKALNIVKGLKPSVVKASDIISRDPNLSSELQVSNFGKPLSEIEYVATPTGLLRPKKVLTPEDLYKEGAYVAPALGDRTEAEMILHEINGVPLAEPVLLQGGGNYQRSRFAPSPWASRPATAKQMLEKIQSQLPDEDVPVYMAHTLMGIPSMDSSHMIAQSLLRQAPNLNLDTSALKKLNDFVSGKVSDKAGEWPGFENWKESEKFLASRPGTASSEFAKALDRSTMIKGGFPDVGAARVAAMDPNLISGEHLASGYSLSRLDPKGKILVDPEHIHETYGGQLPGNIGYAGGFEHQVPARLMFPNWYKNIKPEYLEKKSGRMVPMTPTMYQQALMTQTPVQKADQEWLDNIMSYLEKNKKGWGYYVGGMV